MFEKISIIGRVVYIIYAIELYIKKYEDISKWNILLDVLWSFPQYNTCIDEYAYKIIECTPEIILDEREDYTTFEYFIEKELVKFREIYTSSLHTDNINYLITQINQILAHNLYTSIKIPEPISLEIINTTYLFIEKILDKHLPNIELFEIYHITEEKGWGIFYSKKELLIQEKNIYFR